MSKGSIISIMHWFHRMRRKSQLYHQVKLNMWLYKRFEHEFHLFDKIEFSIIVNMDKFGQYGSNLFGKQ